MRKAEGTAYVVAGGAATVAETATSGDHDSRRSHRCPPACRSSIQGIVACRAWSDSDSLTTHSVTPRRRRNDATMVFEAAHTDVRKHGRFSLLGGHKVAPVTLRAYPSQGPAALTSRQNAHQLPTSEDCSSY